MFTVPIFSRFHHSSPGSLNFKGYIMGLPVLLFFASKGLTCPFFFKSTLFTCFKILVSSASFWTLLPQLHSPDSLHPTLKLASSLFWKGEYLSVSYFSIMLSST